MKVYEFLGTTADVTDCDCCGRHELKYTIVLRHLESGDITNFGRACGARALGWAVKDLDKTVRSEKTRKAQEESARYEAWQTAFDDAVWNHPVTVAVRAEKAAFESCYRGFAEYKEMREKMQWDQRSKQARDEVMAKLGTFSPSAIA